MDTKLSEIIEPAKLRYEAVLRCLPYTEARWLIFDRAERIDETTARLSFNHSQSGRTIRFSMEVTPNADVEALNLFYPEAAYQFRDVKYKVLNLQQ